MAPLHMAVCVATIERGGRLCCLGTEGVLSSEANRKGQMFDLYLRKWKLIWVVGIIGTLAGLGYIFFTPRLYESTASIYTKNLTVLPGAMGELARTFSDTGSPEEEFTKALLDSSSIRLLTYNRLNLDANRKLWKAKPKGGNTERLRVLDTLIKVVARQGLIQIRVRTKDASLSCTIAAAMLDETTKRLISRSQDVTEGIDRKISAAEKNLARAEMSVRSFQEQNGLMPDPREFTKAELDLYHDLISQYATAEVEKTGLVERAAGSGTLERQQAVATDLATISAKSESLKKLISSEEQRIQRRGNLALTQLKLLREVSWQEKILQLTIEQKEQLKLKQATREKPFIIVDEPFAAEEAVPRKALNKTVLAVGLSFFAAFALASTIENFQAAKASISNRPANAP